MEMATTEKRGLLQKAQSVLADVTPSFEKWTKRSGFIRAAILTPCSTAEGKFYYTTDAVGFSGREIALLTETEEFWLGTLSKAFFLPFRNKERPMIFVLLELEEDPDLILPPASEVSVTLKNIVEFKNQTKKIIAKLQKNIETGLGISESRLYMLSLKVCIEEELSSVELPGDELKALVTRSITEIAQTSIAPLFRAPNCSQTGSMGEIKVVLFAKDEEDEQLLAYHVARTLIGLFGTKATKQVLLLSAGLCPNAKGTLEFLCKC